MFLPSDSTFPRASDGIILTDDASEFNTCHRNSSYDKKKNNSSVPEEKEYRDSEHRPNLLQADLLLHTRNTLTFNFIPVCLYIRMCTNAIVSARIFMLHDASTAKKRKKEKE